MAGTRAGLIRAAAVVLMVLAWLAVAPTSLGGSTDYVTTHGNSMEPGFRTGDLALVRGSDRYEVGDVVAYRSQMLQSVLLHRIVDRDESGFVLKGDNNDFLDPERLTSEAFVGGLVLRVPQGGVWLGRLTSPPALAGITLLLMAGGSATSARHRHRRRAMSRHAARPTSTNPRLEALPPAVQTAATVVAGLAILSLLLAAVAWTVPTTSAETVERPTGGAMTFSYSATVRPSPAYDGELVTSPDPVFRKLADAVDVRYGYEGAPATVAVGVELSTASGWRTTLPLSPRTTTASATAEGSVRLDLPALEARARAAGAATGLPVDQVSVRVVADVQAVGAEAFRPELTLNLTPLQLELSGEPADLLVPDSALTQVRETSERRLGLLGHDLPVTTLRLLSALVLLASLVAGAVLLLVARRTAAPSEAAGIHQRYGSLLVEVQPMTSSAGRPVVDVTAFSTLARLAERYGLLVLHWSRSGVETFLVQDDSTTFRYRSGASTAGSLPSADPEPQPVEVTGTATTTVLPYVPRGPGH